MYFLHYIFLVFQLLKCDFSVLRLANSKIIHFVTTHRHYYEDTFDKDFQKSGGKVDVYKKVT
jgi:hypothetical protein